MKRKTQIILLSCILLIAAAFRFYKFAEVPVSPDWDETALGYNAYSILKTGRDEYGKWFPFVFRSFDDYKPPLYVYLAIPSVAVFGLSTFVVRFPSFIAGLLAVVGVFLLARELLRLIGSKDTWSVPLVASLLLAISPWEIQYSRLAFETHIGMTINIYAAYFFLRGRKRTIDLCISAFLFGLAFYAYHSERLFAPVLVILLTLATWKELFANKKRVILAVVVGLLTLLPFFSTFTDPNTFMRIKGTSSFADQTSMLSKSIWKLEDDIKAGDTLGTIFDNRRIEWVKTLFEGYMSHMSMKWMFLTGDLARHHAPGMGLIYLWELPFFLLGIRELFRRGGKVAFIIFGWFLLAPLPAAPTTGLPHSTRTLVFLPSIQLFSAFGVVYVAEWLRAQWNKKKQFLRYGIVVSLIGAGVVIGFSILSYARLYYLHTNVEYSEFWQYGYKEAVEYTKNVYDKYDKIVVSTNLEQPHMFFLFFLKYDPKTYLEEGGTASGGFAEYRNKFGKYQFRIIDWKNEVKDGTILYVGPPGEVPNGSAIYRISYLNGKPAINIADK